MAAKTDVAGRRVAKKGEPALARYVDKDITPVTQDYIDWLQTETGYEVDPMSVQLSSVLRGTFQKSEGNQDRIAAAKQAKLDLIEERETKRAARAEAKVAKEAARAERAAAKAAEPVEKAAPVKAAAKTTTKAPARAAAKPAAKAATPAKKAAPAARRRPARPTAGADSDF